MRRKSKKYMKSKQQIGCYGRKTKKTKKAKKMNMQKNKKGGFGPGSNPFIGAPWDPTTGGYYYANSPLGILPGGNPPYYAENATPSPQHGGIGMPDFLSGPYYSATNKLINVGNQINGLHKIASSNPASQKLQY